MNQIQIPVKPFATFIDAASSWLSKANTMKGGLELRLAKEGNDLHVSVGGDSNYIEAVLDADVAILEKEIFLDMSYLSNYTFDVESLALVIPHPTVAADNKIEKRAQFKAPGQNFRIPLRPGEHWEKNEQNFDQFANAPGFSVTQELMKEIFPYLQLPDSFKIDREKTLPQLVFETVEDGFRCYTDDGFGAFCHVFYCYGFTPTENFSRILIPYEFLIPFKKIEQFTEITLRQTASISVAEFSGIPGFKKFRWVQPKYIKGMANVPEDLSRARAKAETCLVFDTQEFLKNVEKSTVFLHGKDFQDTSVNFSIIKSSYTLSTKTTDSTMDVEGVAKEDSIKSYRGVPFQAACLKEYLKCLDKSNSFNMEILSGTVTLYQDIKTEKGRKMILYWKPTKYG